MNYVMRRTVLRLTSASSELEMVSEIEKTSLDLRQNRSTAGEYSGLSSNPATSAVLIGRNALFTEGLRSVLEGGGVKVTATYNNLDQLTTLVPRTMLIVDCEAEIELAGIKAAIDGLRKIEKSIRIIVLVAPPASIVGGFAQVGANAIIWRDTSAMALLNIVNVVQEDFTIMPADILVRGEIAPAAKTQIPYDDDRPPQKFGRSLSERELSTLRCLVNGESNKEIARRLSIAEATVKIHVKGVLRKISVANRTQAAIWALKHLSPPSRDGVVVTGAVADRQGTLGISVALPLSGAGYAAGLAQRGMRTLSA